MSATLETARESQPELVEKIEEFLAFRKAKKNPVLPESFPAWMKKLTKLSGGCSAVAIEIIDESIANGWTGIFELKSGSGSSFTSKKPAR